MNSDNRIRVALERVQKMDNNVKDDDENVEPKIITDKDVATFRMVLVKDFLDRWDGESVKLKDLL